jgi:hypothetical protein
LQIPRYGYTLGTKSFPASHRVTVRRDGLFGKTKIA